MLKWLRKGPNRKVRLDFDRAMLGDTRTWRFGYWESVRSRQTASQTDCQRSSEVEQLFRKQQVVGSIPTVGSTPPPHDRRFHGVFQGDLLICRILLNVHRLSMTLASATARQGLIDLVGRLFLEPWNDMRVGCPSWSRSWCGPAAR